MGQFNNQPDFGTEAKAILASDDINHTTSLGGACLFVGTGGTVNVIVAGTQSATGHLPTAADAVLFENLPSGSFLPVIVDYVLVADTTAGAIVAIK